MPDTFALLLGNRLRLRISFIINDIYHTLSTRYLPQAFSVTLGGKVQEHAFCSLPRNKANSLQYQNLGCWEAEILA